MGATYTRQSSSAIVDGGVIEASDINAEFNQILAAFAVSSGHTHDGTAAEGGPITKLLGTAITIGDATSGTDIAVTFDGESADGVLTWMEDEDYFQFSDDLLLTTTEKLQFRDTAIYINSSADGQLDLVADTEIQIAATTIDINGAVDISGALTLAGTTLAETISDTVGAMVSSNTETGITVSYEDGDNTLDFALGAAQTTITSLLATDIKIGEDDQTKIDFETADEIHFYAANVEQVYLGDNIFGPQSDSDVDLGSTGVRWKDAFIDTITTTGNVTVGGDLTVTGDDITMGTNTAGNLLVADGTNFNSIAAGSLSEISTVANDDVFIAVDTSGGGLKKIARSTIVAGLATSGAISNVVEDTTPQLGGDLDVNSNGLVSTSNGNIALTPNGTGVVRIDGNVDIQTGLIDLKNGGTVSKIKFYCESSNAHAQTLQSAPHSASSSAVLVLPTASGTLIGTGDTGTLPLASIDIDGGTDIGAAIVDADLFIVDDGAGGTNRKTTASRMKTYFTAGVSSAADDLTAGDAAVNLTTSSGNITIDAAANDSDIIFKGTDNSSDITMLTLDGSAAGAATFNDKVIATELDISGDADIDGTLEADAITINGTAIGSIYGVVAGSSSIVTTGALDSGSITSGFGNIDTGSSTITTTGLISGGSLDIDNVLINGTTIGHTDDTDLLTVADGLLTVAGEISVTTLDIGGTNIASTAAELNIVDGNTSATSTTVADADRVVLNDNGTMVQVAMTDIKTYIGGGTSWQAVKTGDFTAAAGQGVFCNTTSAAFTLTLPASPDIGDEVSFVDYAGTFDTNNLTIGRNSSKIHGADEDLIVSVERAANTLVFTDSTQGWLLKSK
jgi:cytoskeletal protein CcmA (bactofilin family)